MDKVEKTAKEALKARGFSDGEAEQIIDRLKSEKGGDGRTDPEEILPDEKNAKLRRVFGGVGWAGKVRPGAVIVIGEMSELDHGLNAYPIKILDEFETFNLYELVEKMFFFDLYYRKPEMWLSDKENYAGIKLLGELNEKYAKIPITKVNQSSREIDLSHSSLVGNDQFPYVYSALHRLLSQDKKVLTLGVNSRTRAYLSQVNDEDINTIRTGDYPAIEALAYAAIELDRSGKEKRRHPAPRQEYAINDFDEIF